MRQNWQYVLTVCDAAIGITTGNAYKNAVHVTGSTDKEDVH